MKTTTATMKVPPCGMSSLPLISHHLFVAATGNESSYQVKPAENGTLHMRACAGPLEVLDFTQPMPAGTMRSVRTLPAFTEPMEGWPALHRLGDGGPGLPRGSPPEADH